MAQARQSLPCQKVKMEMENSLPGIRPGVNYQAVSILANILLLSQFSRHQEHVSEKASIFFADAVEGSDVNIGDDQEVERGRGEPVLKGSHLFILIDDIGRRLPSNNLAKNTVFRHFNGRFYYNPMRVDRRYSTRPGFMAPG